MTTSPPEAPPRHACGCTVAWTDFVLATLYPELPRPEWYRRLVTNDNREGWWHLASTDLRYHVWRNGRWREARSALIGASPDPSNWRFLDDDE